MSVEQYHHSEEANTQINLSPKLEKESGEEFLSPPFDGILVFGHGWSDRSHKLSLEAKMRAIASYQLWKDGQAPRIILTGGPPPDSFREKYGDIVANGEQMRKMLIDRYHVPPEAIEYEDQSFKTVDNVGHALNVLETKNLPRESFVTVSTGYHLDRIGKIMTEFGLTNHPVPAEQALNERAIAHANTMRQRDEANGLAPEQVEKNWQMRSQRYGKAIERIKASDQTIQNELKDEPHWNKAMENWGYWGPLALAVRGDKLREIVGKNLEEIEPWLMRHPDMNVTIEDLMVGNFDYRELTAKGREVPPLP